MSSSYLMVGWLRRLDEGGIIIEEGEGKGIPPFRIAKEFSLFHHIGRVFWPACFFPSVSSAVFLSRSPFSFFPFFPPWLSFRLSSLINIPTSLFLFFFAFAAYTGVLSIAYNTLFAPLCLCLCLCICHRLARLLVFSRHTVLCILTVVLSRFLCLL